MTERLRQDLIRAHGLSLQELQGVLTEHLQQIQTYASGLCARLDRIEQHNFDPFRRTAVSFGKGEVLFTSEVGCVFCSTSDHNVLARLMDTGELERGARMLIQRFLSPGDVFVDVGASFGFYTLSAARAMQGCGKIIAFEPFEPARRLLEKSVCMNGFQK
jgi:hypothetical protein